MKFFDKVGGYDARVHCSNCKKNGEVRVKRGVTVSDFLKMGDAKCSYCGCNTLKEIY